MSLFFLIITFWTPGAAAIAVAMLPDYYNSEAQCDLAGQHAKDHYNGGSKVEWTCVTAATAP